MGNMDDAQSAVAFLVDNPHLNDINPLHCGWHKRLQGRCFGPGVRDHYILHYVLSGKGTYLCGGRSFPLETGQVFLIRPGHLMYYEADTADPWTYSWIGFEGSAAEPLLAACGFSEERYTAPLPEMDRFFRGILRWMPEQPVSGVLLCAALYELFSHLQQGGEGYRTAPERYVRQAQEYIRANYSRPITVEGIARMLGIDRRYFSRIFTAYAGVSPQEYLINFRMERAEALLGGGLCNVSEAAQSVGYTDVFNFSRMYKRKTGHTAAETMNRRKGEHR